MDDYEVEGWVVYWASALADGKVEKTVDETDNKSAFEVVASMVAGLAVQLVTR